MMVVDKVESMYFVIETGEKVAKHVEYFRPGGGFRQKQRAEQMAWRSQSDLSVTTMTTLSVHSAAQNSKPLVCHCEVDSESSTDQLPLIRTLISEDAKQVNAVDGVCSRVNYLLTATNE